MQDNAMCFTLSVNLYKTQLFAPSFTNGSFISGRKFCLQVRINLWPQLCNREEITSGLLESLGFSWRTFGAVSRDPDCWGSYTPDCRTESTSTCLMYILTDKGDISAVSWDPCFPRTFIKLVQSQFPKKSDFFLSIC